MMLHSERYVVELRNSYRVAAKIKMLQKGRWMSEDFVCPDRTVEQRKAQKGILEQLTQMRTENLGARYRIKIRVGEWRTMEEFSTTTLTWTL